MHKDKIDSDANDTSSADENQKKKKYKFGDVAKGFIKKIKQKKEDNKNKKLEKDAPR